MVNEVFKNMLNVKSVIRELSEYATLRALEVGRENVFDYTLGNPSVAPPKEFDEAISDIYKTTDPVALHGYSPTLCIPYVKEAVASYLQREFGIKYAPEHIFMTSGAASAIVHAVRAVTKPGDTVLGFAPFFPEYIHYVGGSGAVYQPVDADWATMLPDFEKFEKAIDTNVSAVLINSPNNPTGVIYDETTLKTIADILYRKQQEFGHEIFLISDEPYREIVFDNKKMPYPSAFYDNSISCYSYSKSISVPGERIGYIAVNPKAKDADLIVPMCGQISRGIGHNCPASTMQHAVARLLGKTSDLSVYEKNMNLLYDTLLSCGVETIRPGGTFYIFAKALEEDATAFCKKALKYDLVFVPAATFGAPGHFRIAYCVETEKVERSLPVIERFIKETYGNR